MGTTLSFDTKLPNLSNVADELLNQFVQILVSNYENGNISTLINNNRNCFVVVGSEFENEFLYFERFDGVERIRFEGHNSENVYFETIFNLSEENLSLFPEEMIDALTLSL